MSQVNTEGTGIVFPHALEPLWGWWAWTPDGLMMGKEPSESAARAEAREAQQATRLRPKGEG